MTHNQERTRIIIVSSVGVSLTPGFVLEWTDTNLPAEHFTIHSGIEYSWKIKLKSYERDQQHLVVGVLDYFPMDTHLFNTQQLKQGVRSIEFEKLNWYYFAGFVSAYKKSALLPYIIDSEEVYIPGQKVQHYQYQLKVSFNSVKFVLGGVEFWTDLPALGEPVELRIDNTHILPEFEFIKGYFSKALGKKTLDVLVKLTINEDRIRKLICTSKQIDLINEKMVGTLRNTRILGLRKAPKVIAIDKHLFNSDEIFNEYYDEPDANLFHQNALDIIQSLTDLGVVRNRKQLEYLAGRKQLSNQRILITLAPHFGFLFVVAGDQKNHFIWELINSHATYVWTFDNDSGSLEQQLKKVEEIVGIVRDQGREKYKNYYQSNLVDLPYYFNSVVHRHADRGIVDPFPNWKHRLEEALQ
ncbi:MAG: hypothetical protein IPL46_28850 [Saprospiraceae bacterium]|nr:hypothetical protein [Saprospiraceae bacterium]